MTKKGCFIIILLLSMSFYGCDDKDGDRISEETKDEVEVITEVDETVGDEQLPENNSKYNTLLKKDPLADIQVDSELSNNNTKSNENSECDNDRPIIELDGQQYSIEMNNDRFDGLPVHIYHMDADNAPVLFKSLHVIASDYYIENDKLYITEANGQLLQLNQHFEVEKIIEPVDAQDREKLISNNDVFKQDNDIMYRQFYQFHAITEKRTQLYPMEKEGINEEITTLSPSGEYSELLTEGHVYRLNENNRFEGQSEKFKIFEMIDEDILELDFNSQFYAYSLADKKEMRIVNRIDGSKTILNGISGVNIQIYNNTIYYTNTNDGSLYSYVDGVSTMRVDRYIHHYEIIDNTIYYTDYLTRQLYRMDLEKTMEERISRYPVNRFIKHHNNIYFMNRMYNKIEKSYENIYPLSRINNDEEKSSLEYILPSAADYFFEYDNQLVYGQVEAADMFPPLTVTFLNYDKSILEDMVLYKNESYTLYRREWYGHHNYSGRAVLIYDNKNKEILTVLPYVEEEKLEKDWYLLKEGDREYRFNIKTGELQEK